jgi:hypothetical protein
MDFRNNTSSEEPAEFCHAFIILGRLYELFPIKTLEDPFSVGLAQPLGALFPSTTRPFVFAVSSPTIRPMRRRKPMFSSHSEICTQCWTFISVSEVRRVDREYGLCPHCGMIYSVEVA